MAEQDGDKTEAPTPRKRQEAREQGKVARSQDLVASALLLATIVVLGATGQNLTTTLKQITESFLGPASLRELDPAASLFALYGPLVLITRAMAPLVVTVLVVAVLINVVQVGLHASPQRLQPNFGSLNPMKGVQRLLGGGRGPMQLAFNLVKMGLVAAVAWSAIAGRLGHILNVAERNEMQIATLAATLVYDVTLRVAVVLLVIAILDYAWQRFRFERDLRMTKQEVKDEMKRMEGDPIIKQRRRQIQMQRAMQRVRKEVPKADVIVTNPTHYAVALQYDQGNMHAPKVVAKGADHLALKIREIAAEHGIPIVERPPLARALYKDCDIGQEIPTEFYSAVAEILAYVYELTGKGKRRVASAQ